MLGVVRDLVGGRLCVPPSPLSCARTRADEGSHSTQATRPSPSPAPRSGSWETGASSPLSLALSSSLSLSEYARSPRPSRPQEPSTKPLLLRPARRGPALEVVQRLDAREPCRRRRRAQSYSLRAVGPRGQAAHARVRAEAGGRSRQRRHGASALALASRSSLSSRTGEWVKLDVLARQVLQSLTHVPCSSTTTSSTMRLTPPSRS